MPPPLFSEPRSPRAFQALLAVAVAVPVLLFVLTALDGRKKILEGAGDDTRQIAAMLHQHALKVFENHELILQQLDSWTAGRDWDEIASDERLKQILRAATTQGKEIKAISITDSAGIVRICSEPLAGPVDVSDRDYFLAQRDRDAGTYIGVTHPRRVSGVPVFASSLRRTTRSGEFAGILQVSIEPRYFSEFWKGVAHDLDAVVMLTRSDGAILARYPDISSQTVTLGSDSPLLQAIRHANEGMGLAWRSPIDGSERIISYKKLAGYPVYISFSVGRQTVLARWYKEIAWQGGITLAAIAALGFLGFLALRRARAQAEAEALAQQNETRLRRILESTTDNVFVLDGEWRFSYLNERARAAIEHGRELLGVSIWEAFPEAVGSPFWDTYHKVKAEQIPASIEAFYTPLKAWFEAHAYPLDSGIAVFFRDIAKRKRAEQALRRSEEHLARAQRAAAVGTWEWDAASGAVIWSDETYRLFGVSPETFVPSFDAVLDLLHEEDRAAVLRICIMISQGRIPAPADIALDQRTVAADGSVRVLRREGGAVFDADGRPTGLIGTIRDVTELRAAEEQMRLSEERYRLAAQAARCRVWDWDCKTDHVVFADHDDMFGYSVEQQEPTHSWWEQRVHPDDRERVLRRLKVLSEGGQLFLDEEYRFRRADGSYAFVRDCAYMIRDASREPLRMIGAMFDVTEWKEMEDELRRNAAHLARAQRVASLGSFEFDPRSGAHRWSDEKYRIYGVDPESFTPTIERAEELIHPEDLEIFRHPLEMIRQGRRPSVSDLSCDYRIVRPDGEVRVLHRECDLLIDAAGEIISVVGTVQDVTDIRVVQRQSRELEAQLLHAQKMDALGTMAGGIAHDLNNTLVPVIALSKLLQVTFPEASRERDNLSIIHNAGIRARDLVKQILAFSRKEQPKKQMIDLAVLIDDVIAMLCATLPATIRIELATEDIPQIVADPAQIHQVLVNLVNNAAQAIGNDIGTIRLALSSSESPDGRRVHLSVSDTGCGMDEKTRQRIFDPFFTTKPAGEGTGLGLSVVHGIVANHGGTIHVTSALRQGTCFEIEFPLPDEDNLSDDEHSAFHPRAV